MADNRVKWHGDIMAAGVSYDGRHEVVKHHVREGDDCLLVRELNHPRDEHAIQIHTLNGQMVGYVPKDNAKSLAEYLDEGQHVYNAYFSRVLTEGKHPTPCVRFNVYLNEAELDDRTLRTHSVINYQPERKQAIGRRRNKQKVSWLTWLILALLLWLWLG